MNVGKVRRFRPDFHFSATARKNNPEQSGDFGVLACCFLTFVGYHFIVL